MNNIALIIGNNKKVKNARAPDIDVYSEDEPEKSFKGQAVRAVDWISRMILSGDKVRKDAKYYGNISRHQLTTHLEKYYLVHILAAAAI